MSKQITLKPRKFAVQANLSEITPELPPDDDGLKTVPVKCPICKKSFDYSPGIKCGRCYPVEKVYSDNVEIEFQYCDKIVEIVKKQLKSGKKLLADITFDDMGNIVLALNSKKSSLKSKLISIVPDQRELLSKISHILENEITLLQKLMSHKDFDILQYLTDENYRGTVVKDGNILLTAKFFYKVKVMLAGSVGIFSTISFILSML